MRSTAFKIIYLCLMFGLVSTATAQEGHPLKGSWIGVWDSNAIHGNNVLIVLDWDGQEISGIINPGTDDIEITNAELDPSDWSVTIEATANEDGNRINYVIVGNIERLEQANREIVGSWRHQNGNGRFEIIRQ